MKFIWSTLYLHFHPHLELNISSDLLLYHAKKRAKENSFQEKKKDENFKILSQFIYFKSPS